MAKKAFCVGINDYPYAGFDLHGCVNDATAWAELLINHFDFPSSDVKIVTDSDATKKSIIKGLKNLLKGAKSGDVLVFTNSSHGSYISDKSGDEYKYDEVLCPYDVKDNVIVDDEFRELFTNLPQSVKLTVIADCCYSGTITRNIPALTPDDRRMRFLNPALRGDPVLRNPWVAKPKRIEKYPESAMKEILISGCTDREYSYDARFGGVYHGAMTYFALQKIRESNYKITYAKLIKHVNHMLDQAGYPQHPQLEGNPLIKEQQIFT